MTILLVSDIPDHVPHYIGAFRRAGYGVAVAQTVADAYRQAVARRPAVIVIDERVSDTMGWDLCKRLKADLRLRETPIVMLAETLATQEVSGGQRSGCNSWLARPTTSRDLLRAVEHVLAQAASTPSEMHEALLGVNLPGVWVRPDPGSHPRRTGAVLHVPQVRPVLAPGRRHGPEARRRLTGPITRVEGDLDSGDDVEASGIAPTARGKIKGLDRQPPVKKR